MLMVRVSPDGGRNLRIVASYNGRVVGETMKRLPHDPSQRDYAVSLRMFADWLCEADDFRAEPKK